MMKAGIALVSFLAAVGAAPLAHAARVCSNTLSDGRIIVQGPLVDSFGAPCSRAVLLPTHHASRGEVTIIDSAGFNRKVIILGPHSRGQHRAVFFVERSFRTAPFGLVDPRFRRFGFAAGGAGRFTTGSIGPFTTFSNSGAVPPPFLSTLRNRVVRAPSGAFVRRR
jgi:hypothetical protein